MLAFVLSLALAANEGHNAPAPTLERSEATERQKTLAEMWQRRILPTSNDRWSEQDLGVLMLLREAERAGAIADLRRAYNGNLKGLAVAGRRGEAVKLTKEGLDRWLFLRSQQALEYFASREIDAKEAFQLTDLEGSKLFDASGLLTPAGESVYMRVKANVAAHWKHPDGTVSGNRRKAPEPPKQEAPLAITIGPEHPSLMRAQGAPYEPIMRGAALGRLMVVQEHDPSDSAGRGYVVVVARQKDKAAARAEFKKRLPDRGAPPADRVLTIEEKLAEIDPRWSLDKGAVEKELRGLLKGKLALVWALAGPPPPEPAPEPAAPAPAAATPAPESIGSGTAGPQQKVEPPAGAAPPTGAPPAGTPPAGQQPLP